jgi:hyperosmotically inducible periplasmic protein
MKSNAVKSILIAVAIVLNVSPLRNHISLASPLWPQNDHQRIKNMIIKDVRYQLVTLPHYNVFDWLEFEVKDDDSVILRGQVARPSTKSDAEKRIRKLEEVSRVINQIEVLPLSSSDDRLRLRIYRNLFSQNSPLFRYSIQSVPPIHIIVRNGRVTLKGVVATQLERTVAGSRVNSIPGIFEVKNELQVERKD